MRARHWLAFATVLGCGPAAAAPIFSCYGSNIGLNFGTYSFALTSPLDSSQTFKVSCDNIGTGNGTASGTIGINGGNSGNVNGRYLLQSGVQLNYNLYQDSGRATVWGNTAADWMTFSIGNVKAGDPAGSHAQVLTIYGRIPTGQDVPAGGSTYGDTLTITITY